MYKIKLLVSGLAALVATNVNEVTILMPKVDREEWQRCGCKLQSHVAFFSYVCDQWTPSDPRRVRRSPGGEGVCWIQLQREDVTILGVGEQVPRDSPEVNLLFQRNLPLDRVVQLQAIDWVPVMADIDPERSVVLKSLLDADDLDHLQGRATLNYASWHSCGLVSLIGQSGKRASIQQYSFKDQRSDFSLFNRRQALASAAMFEVEVARPSPVTVQFTSLDTGTVGLELTLDDMNSEEDVDIGMAQLIHDSETLLAAFMRLLNLYREGRDSHFRVYYSLVECGPECQSEKNDDRVKLPFKMHGSRSVGRSTLAESCSSALKYPSGTITALQYWGVGRVSSVDLGDELARDADLRADLVELLAQDAGSDLPPGLLVSPWKAPADYRLMSILGPPLCTPVWLER